MSIHLHLSFGLNGESLTVGLVLMAGVPDADMKNEGSRAYGGDACVGAAFLTVS